MKRFLTKSAAAGLALSMAGAFAGSAYADNDRYRHAPRYSHTDKAYEKYQRDVRKARERYERSRYRDQRRDYRHNSRAYRRGYEDGVRSGRYSQNDRYYSGNQRIYDYGRYGLQSPPNGQYYAQQPNGDIVLVLAATQLITSLLNGY